MMSLRADPTVWTPANWSTLAAIVGGALTTVLVSGWSHRHDRKMRERDFKEQRNVRAEDHRLRWIERGQELVADARSALLNELTPENLTAADARDSVRVAFDEKLRSRFSLLPNFAPDERVRKAASVASDKIVDAGRKLFTSRRCCAGSLSALFL